MGQKISCKLTEKQYQALELIGVHKIVNLFGGSRSGKTFIALYAIIIRCIKYPNTNHLVSRFRFSHAKQSICFQTMPALLRILGINDRVLLNKSDWFYIFPNGSTIWIGGLDDKERTEKILGNEYATIFLNEASQISFASYEIIITRLNPPKGVKGKVLIDYNPPSITHWGYKMFVKHEYPDGRPVDVNEVAALAMNPKDNLENISEDYIKTLESLSVNKRKRFLEGEYSVDSGALWKRAWIRYTKTLPDMIRVVVGVDPSGSVGGDEIGIVVTGQGTDMKYYVLDDYSLHGTPNEWAREVCAAYEKWNADIIAAERNYGGDMVEATIKNVNQAANVKLVTASRGKIVRAEPVSALYEHGDVLHRITFLELEDEMCIYDPGESESPNRMDALVWGITELCGGGVSMLDVL